MELSLNTVKHTWLVKVFDADDCEIQNVVWADTYSGWCEVVVPDGFVVRKTFKAPLKASFQMFNKGNWHPLTEKVLKRINAAHEAIEAGVTGTFEILDDNNTKLYTINNWP